MASLPKNENRTMAAVVALVIRTLDVDLYWQFANGTMSDQNVVDRICERFGITDALKGEPFKAATDVRHSRLSSP